MDDSPESNRDPSFLSCRSEILEPWNTKKNVVPRKLTDSAWNLTDLDHYKVYLRLKPNAQGNNTHNVLDRNTLLTDVPEESVSFKVLSSTNSGSLKRKFAFSYILDESATQKETFQSCVLPSLKSFLRGEDCLVMAYGTTSAGKTFTMQGTAQHPGIIPRALSYIFRSLEGLLEQCDTLQPYRGTQLIALNDADLHRELDVKRRILGLDLAKYQKAMESSYMSFTTYSRDDDSYESAAFKEMESQISRDHENITEDLNDRFTVWVSMVEIYNETVMDLLRFPTEKGEQPSLNLGEDERGFFYVKNAKQVHVRNGHEAYQVYQFGRTNLHRAPTALNDKSSRSHCLFTVNVVRHGETGNSLHRFSFVDLAGSERMKKTLNIGKRLAESNSINKSLSVLGKCLQALKENQMGRAQRIIPLRDSKMTKLFKNALLGNEKLTFIINISTDPLLFDETLHVLKFAALAQEIVPEMRPPRPVTRFSRIYHSNRLREQSLAWSATSSLSDLTDKSDQGDAARLRIQLVEAERRIAEMEEKHTSEVEKLRTDLADAEDRVTALGELVMQKDGQMADMRANLNNHLYKVMNEKEARAQSELEFVTKQLKKEQSEQVAFFKKSIQNLRSKIKTYENQERSMLEDDAYRQLEEENKKLRSQKKNLEILLDEASQDYKEVEEINQELDKKHLALFSELEEQCKRVDELESQLAEQIVTMENSSAQLKNALQELDICTTEKTNCIEEKQKVESDLEYLQKTWEAETKALVARIEEKTAESAELMSQLEDMQEKLALEAKVPQNVRAQLDDERASKLDLQKELDEHLVALKLETTMKEALQTKLEQSTELIANLQKLVDKGIADGTELKSTLDKETNSRRALEQELERERQVRGELEREMVELGKVLQQLKRSKDEAEGEVVALRRAVKEACTREMNLRTEVDALKAALHTLEEEASLRTTQEINGLSDQIRVLNLEKTKLSDLLASKENEKRDYIRTMEMELEACRKKLEVAEYQSKVFQTMKEKADEEASAIPHLKEMIERLENELKNKEQEFRAFENQRNFVLAQQEREVKKYLDEIERLKKDVHFGHAVVMENLRNSAKKDEVKRLQDELHAKNMKLVLLEKNLNERSPLRNRTNMVPTGQLVEISPFYKMISKSQEDVSSFKPKQVLFPSSSLENICPNVEVSKTSKEGTALAEETEHSEAKPLSPPPAPKSSRKPRTAKKRDPLDHPALSKASRGRRRSLSPQEVTTSAQAPRSVKKQLFSCDEFVELSDDSDFIAVSPTNLRRPKRTLRPRAKRS